MTTRDLIERAKFVVRDNYPSPHIHLVGELLAELSDVSRQWAWETDPA